MATKLKNRIKRLEGVTGCSSTDDRVRARVKDDTESWHQFLEKAAERLQFPSPFETVKAYFDAVVGKMG